MTDRSAPLTSRILVVDDNAAIHVDMRKIFATAERARLGDGATAAAGLVVRVDSAYQGEEALGLVRQALAQGDPYVLAFMDVRMPPGWDGIDTTARIWEVDPDIQIVVCSNHADYSSNEMLAKLGYSDRLVILRRPFDDVEVLQLTSALSEKWRLARTARGVLAELERLVGERTRELQRANRALTALGRCNMALIHAQGDSELFNEVCRIVVDAAGYRQAWVGIVAHDAQKSVHAVAHAGYPEGFMAQAQIIWDDSPVGRGPVGKAIRTRQPQLMADAETDPDYAPWRNNALALGYRSVLGLPLLNDAAVLGVLCIYAVDRDGFDDEELKLLGELANDLAFGITTLRARAENTEHTQRLGRSLESTIAALAGALELRDAYTAGHQRRVAELAAAIAGALGYSEHDVHGIRLAASVHDLGKILVPSEILSKPSQLTSLEYQLVQGHAEAGYNVLKDIDFPWPIAQMVYQHHERLDGSGYPRGLKGDEILPGARIIAVADTVEAMSSHRPYRVGRGLPAALAKITAQRGTGYAEDVVDACLKLFERNGFAFSSDSW